MNTTDLLLLILIGIVLFTVLHPRSRRVYRHHYGRARSYYNGYRSRRY